MKTTKKLNNLTEEQEAAQWEIIDRMENGGKTLVELYGDDEAIRLLYAKLHYFQKRSDRLVVILMKRYEETGDKKYLHFLDRMGVDVDYSINDYRG